jgi:hypothetical protein
VGIAIVDAARLARTNKVRYEDLADRHERLVAEAEAETAAAEAARSRMYGEALVSFRDVFSRLKNVDLAELGSIDGLPGADLPDVELRRVRLSATHTIGVMAGGAVAGAGAGAATFAAVGTFAAASTGTAISSLSGAAATSATLAWLGGGSLAAGGGGVAAGTTVLTAVVATPVVLALGGVVEWQGRKARHGQRETAAKIAEADAELRLAETTTAAARERSQQVRVVLDDLRDALIERLPSLEAVLVVNDDYATYTAPQRGQVALLVGLATTAVAVMSTRITDGQGIVTDLSARVVQDARDRLDAMGVPASASAA